MCAFVALCPSARVRSATEVRACGATRRERARARVGASAVRMTSAPLTSTDRASTTGSESGSDEGEQWEAGAAFIPYGEGPSFKERLAYLQHKGALTSATAQVMERWKSTYYVAASQCVSIGGASEAQVFTERAFSTLLDLLVRHESSPIDFQPYHRALTSPYDYYQFGVDFASPLCNIGASDIVGMCNLESARQFLSKGHNVVFLSNHQSEADPYAIDALLTSVAKFPRAFARNLIFMAGDRVREDPLVAPFSAGRDLLTVYSKRHLDDVPELRAQKVAHNRRTVSVTQRLFRQGGRAVWFAPSGGRDRRSAQTGRVEIADLDPDAIEMMRLSARKSGTPTHFFPMVLVTYEMLPPPQSVGGATMGEERVVNHVPLRMFVDAEIDFRQVVPPDVTDKLHRRDTVRKHVQRIIELGYASIGGYDI